MSRPPTPGVVRRVAPKSAQRAPAETAAPASAPKPEPIPPPRPLQAATAPIWNLIERGREIGLHVIAARLPGNWAGVSAMSPFLQKLTGARTPTLFLDNDPATVKVFGRTSAAQLPPGRGLLVTTEGTIEGVLVGTPD